LNLKSSSGKFELQAENAKKETPKSPFKLKYVGIRN
jgi:hypothetical protein